MKPTKPLIIYVDIDETIVRNYGNKRIPMPNVIKHIKDLYNEGVELYCWSSGGTEYAENSSKEFGIHNCFKAFLPKPNILIDDQSINDWNRFKVIHPMSCDEFTLEQYFQILEQ